MFHPVLAANHHEGRSLPGFGIESPSSTSSERDCAATVKRICFWASLAELFREVIADKRNSVLRGVECARNLETGKREPNEARNSEANDQGRARARARAREGAVNRTPVPSVGADGVFRLVPGDDASRPPEKAARKALLSGGVAAHVRGHWLRILAGRRARMALVAGPQAPALVRERVVYRNQNPELDADALGRLPGVAVPHRLREKPAPRTTFPPLCQRFAKLVISCLILSHTAGDDR